MEGALQRVKAYLTALASQLRSMLKDQIDSTTAEINHVRESVRGAMESVREAMERMDQKLAEEVSRIKEKNESGTFQTSHQSVEVVMPCRRENNDDEDEESEVDDFKSAMGSSDYIQVDEDEFLDFQDMEKDEAAGEDGAVTLVADVVVIGGEESKF